MKQIIQYFAPLCLVALSQMTASAHPGHGHGESGPTHYVTEPQHAIVMVAALLSIVVIAIAVRMIVVPVKRGS